MNYAEAATLLTGRCKDRRKLQNNTYLERREPFYRRTGFSHSDAFAVRLHATDILTFFADGRIGLNTGGWNTVTTRDRLSSYLPRPWHVWSERGTLVLGTYQDGLQGQVLVNPYAAVRPDGTVDGDSYVEYRERRDAEERVTRRVRSRLRRWVQKARALYIDRSGCEYGVRNWGCEFQIHPFSGLRHLPTQEGTFRCGCRVYRKPPNTKRLTVAKIMAEPNVSVRVAMMHVYGLDRFLLDAGAKVIDEEAGYQLLDFNVGNSHASWGVHIHALKMTCPSTSAVYINAVPPHINTVCEGLDWVFDVKNYLGQVAQES
jgi:hypothetical protein